MSTINVEFQKDFFLVCENSQGCSCIDISRRCQFNEILLRQQVRETLQKGV